MPSVAEKERFMEVLLSIVRNAYGKTFESPDKDNTYHTIDCFGFFPPKINKDSF